MSHYCTSFDFGYFIVTILCVALLRAKEQRFELDEIVDAKAELGGEDSDSLKYIDNTGS